HRMRRALYFPRRDEPATGAKRQLRRRRPRLPRHGRRTVGLRLHHPQQHFAGRPFRKAPAVDRQLGRQPGRRSVHDGGAVQLRAKPNLSTVLATTVGSLPVITVGRYGKGRSMALAGGITEPWSGEFTRWGQNDHRYYAKFWRNAVYWMTESSSIGRRRLIASADKKFYRPGEMISLAALAYDEGANRTREYRIVAMIEPAASSADLASEYSPVRWPDGLQRTSGEEGPFIAWGEEFELAKVTGKEG